MNWRVILGLVLLLVGMMGLYSVMGNSGQTFRGMSPSSVTAGCVIWMLVGVFFIVKGMRK